MTPQYPRVTVLKEVNVGSSSHTELIKGIQMRNNNQAAVMLLNYADKVHKEAEVHGYQRRKLTWWEMKTLPIRRQWQRLMSAYYHWKSEA